MFSPPDLPPTPLTRLLQPIQNFIHQSTAGGIVLLVSALTALLLANSPLAAPYHELLHLPLGLTIGATTYHLSLLHAINDGLMAIFFLLVGLEIKREILVGELADRRAATLPIMAALGGAIVPALIYLAFNLGRPSAAGWGIPMATDIAFALGCLALLGDRVPFSLKIFLTAVAIVDDLLAVLVIALFYSSDLNFMALSAGLALLFLLALGNVFGLRSLSVYLLLGGGIWLAFLASGIHATIAGVLVALTIPARYQIDEPTFLARASDLLAQFRAGGQGTSRMVTDERQQSAVLALEELCEQVQAPLQKVEHELHLPVSFLIVPLFALANAGVPLTTAGLSADAWPVFWGISLGLLVGKPVGLVGASWLVTRLGWATLPPGVRWSQMAAIGVLAGMGFTMSLFIAALGLGESSPLLDVAKLAILGASLVAALVGMGLLVRAGRTDPELSP